MCETFKPPDDGWTTAVDGGPVLIDHYPTDLPNSDNWLPDDEGVNDDAKARPSC